MDLTASSTLILPRTRSPRVVIQETSLQPLMQADLLNDEVINGALRLLEAAAGGDGVFVFDPMAPLSFMQKKMAEFPSMKFIIPMNILDIHWVLGIRRPNQGIQVYDSLPGATSKAAIRSRFPANIDNLPVRISSPLQQRGAIDCGVFTIFTAFYDVLGFDLDHFKPPAPREDGLPQPYDPDPKFWRQKLLLQLLRRRRPGEADGDGSGSSPVVVVTLDDLEHPEDEQYLLGQTTAATRTRNIMRQALKRAEATIDGEKYPEARGDVLGRFRDAERLCGQYEQLCHDALSRINERRKKEASLKRKRGDVVFGSRLVGWKNTKLVKNEPENENDVCYDNRDPPPPPSSLGEEQRPVGSDEEQQQQQQAFHDDKDTMSSSGIRTSPSRTLSDYNPFLLNCEVRNVEGGLLNRTRSRPRRKKALVGK